MSGRIWRWPCVRRSPTPWTASTRCRPPHSNFSTRRPLRRPGRNRSKCWGHDAFRTAARSRPAAAGRRRGGPSRRRRGAHRAAGGVHPRRRGTVRDDAPRVLRDARSHRVHLRRPAEALAAQWNDLGGRAASYRFEWSPDDAPLGACHCLELPFLFGSPEAWADAAMLGNERRIDPTLADEMRTVWTQFAHHGVDALPARSLRFG